MADFASLFLQTQQQKNKNVDVKSPIFARIWRFDGSLLVEFTVVKILEQCGEFAFWQYSSIAGKKNILSAKHFSKSKDKLCLDQYIIFTQLR